MPQIPSHLTNTWVSFIIVNEILTTTTVGNLGLVNGVDGFSETAEMAYIASGVVAFIIAGFFDLAALRGWRYVKQIVGLATILVTGYACWGLLRTSARLPLSAPLTWLGWPLLVVAMCLLVYSLFIEIPFRQTYGRSGVGDTLVTSGTYALCRHPGVLWYGLCLIALFLVSRAQLLLVAAPIWFLLDVLHVWIQDVYFFPRMFSTYPEYQQHTPMLVPVKESIVRSLQTFSLAAESHVREDS